ncbi:hypothetical protein [Pseudomonas violetae]|uniref:Uncharacterized protein n=1 Tax=Pseudomonas violetae TaxID=2915813 RepID=A0ABT0EU93_9PSED|nr:hypothetical protein [Pseudomonas violetae]MCK1788979.1 hypothetical protein [Pseudomonas violetae]
MKKTYLLALALTLLTSGVAQAEERLKVVTAVTVDGKVVVQNTREIENGETITFTGDGVKDNVINFKAEPNVRVNNKQVPMGFNGTITPRILSNGMILVMVKGYYREFTGYTHLDQGKRSMDMLTDTLVDLTGNPSAVDLGDDVVIEVNSSTKPHNAQVKVTVTRT